MKQGVAFILISVIIAFTGICAERIVVHSTGEYAKIDTRLTEESMKALKNPDPRVRADVVKKITSSPENYAPPALYLLSSVIFQDGSFDEAIFWFYAGQLRGLIDAQICTDGSARDEIRVLNERFCLPINQIAFKDIPKLKSIIEKVLKWEEATPCKYDRRWINLHGIDVFQAKPEAPLSAPADQWDAIRKKTREKYASSFYRAIEQLQSKSR